MPNPDVYSGIPNEEAVIERLTDFLELFLTADEHQLYHFFLPLLALGHQAAAPLLMLAGSDPMSTEASPAQKPDQVTTAELRQWAWSFQTFIGELLGIVMRKLDQEDQDKWLTRTLEACMGFYHLAEYTGTLAQCTRMTWWLYALFDHDNFHGDDQGPFFAWIESRMPGAASLPRVLERNDWTTGFGGRLLVPATTNQLQASKTAHLWDVLLTKKKVYEASNVDNTVRQRIFSGILSLFPVSAVKHLDLCGGKGDFIAWLEEQRKQDTHSVLADIASKAAKYARQNHHIPALVSDGKEGLPFGATIDVVTIIFAAQWLPPQTFTEVYKVLKTGGCLIFNVYPPNDLQLLENTLNNLLKSGFQKIERLQVTDGIQRKHTVLRAWK